MSTENDRRPSDSPPAAGSAAVWQCPRCRTEYVTWRTRRAWRERGHCAKCEVDSWPVEQRAEVEACFNAAWPAIKAAIGEPQRRLQRAGQMNAPIANLDAMAGFSARTGSASLPAVLDPCCGPRMWWFDKADSRALFGDRRSETLTVTDRSHGNADGTRTLRIDPDVNLDFRALPYGDESFHLVAFDPPHLVRAGAKSWLAAKYGKLGPDWREDLRAGFAECFRVLRPHGVLVFKWNETQVKIREVLSLTPQRPLFGNTSGKKAGTHWIVFTKPNAELRHADKKPL